MTLISIILQVAIGLFAQNPDFSASNLSAYYPQDTLVSEAPAGYKPFYISHIARHGSRFLVSGKNFKVIDQLDEYAKAGKLTDEGLAMLQDLRVLHDMSEGHYGELTPLGEREHKEICERMVRHYPEVFQDENRRHIDAYSTNSGRVIKSMESFLEEFDELTSGLRVEKNITKKGCDPRINQEVRGFNVSKEDKELGKKNGKHFSATRRKLQKGHNFKEFAAKIFVYPDSIEAKKVSEIARMSQYCFRTAIMVEMTAMAPLKRYFTPDELYNLWLSSNFSWAKYLQYPGMKHFTYPYGRGIIECMVEDADEAIGKRSHTAATLRFSHDTYLMPLMAAFPFEGLYLECEDIEIPEVFQDWRYICPACNVQLIFFRNKKNKILVKFLVNEKETLLHGLAPDKGCFYEWGRVKKFLKG